MKIVDSRRGILGAATRHTSRSLGRNDTLSGSTSPKKRNSWEEALSRIKKAELSKVLLDLEFSRPWLIGIVRTEMPA